MASTTKSTIRKVGSSLGLIVNHKSLFSAGLQLNDKVEITSGKEKLIIKKAKEQN